MGIEIKPLSETCGAEVIGIDAKRPLSESEVHTIENAFNRYKVLLIRQQPLTPRELARLSAHLKLLHLLRSEVPG